MFRRREHTQHRHVGVESKIKNEVHLRFAGPGSRRAGGVAEHQQCLADPGGGALAAQAD